MRYLLRGLTHPAFVLIFTIFGTLGFIEFLHTRAHQTMEVDAHGYVRQFCKKNSETCERFLSDQDY